MECPSCGKNILLQCPCGYDFEYDFKSNVKKEKPNLKCSNKQLSVYLFWVFLNFMFLVIGGGSSMKYKYFYPLHDTNLRYFDITEFFFYTIMPLLIFIIYRLWRSDKSEESYQIKFSKMILKPDLPWSKEYLLELVNKSEPHWFNKQALSYLLQKMKEFEISPKEIKKDLNKWKYKIFLRRSTHFGHLFGKPSRVIPFIMTIGFLIYLNFEVIPQSILAISFVLMSVIYFIFSYYFDY